MTGSNIGTFISTIFGMFGGLYNAIMSNWLLALLMAIFVISAIAGIFLSLFRKKRK